MGIKNAIYLGRARTVEDAVEAWKRDYEEADKVKDIESIICEWLRVAEALTSWQRESWELLQTGKLDNVLEVGRMLEKAHRICPELFDAVNEGAKWAEQKGYTVENIGSFREISANLCKLKKRFETKWPRVDKAELEAGLASWQHGHTVDISGWLSELQGKGAVA